MTNTCIIAKHNRDCVVNDKHCTLHATTCPTERVGKPDIFLHWKGYWLNFV